MKDSELIIDCGLIYQFKFGGSCSDCCFMLDTENECIASNSLPFPCQGSWSYVGEAPLILLDYD